MDKGCQSIQLSRGIQSRPQDSPCSDTLAQLVWWIVICFV